MLFNTSLWRLATQSYQNSDALSISLDTVDFSYVSACGQVPDNNGNNKMLPLSYCRPSRV